MKEKIGSRKCGEKQRCKIVALVAGPDEHARERDRHRGKKGEVEWCRNPDRGDDERQASRKPQQGQHCERDAGWRGLASPGTTRGKQKTRDDRAGEAEEHLVGVP